MVAVTVSAPAKLFILGEHAVVYDGQAIVTAVDARLSVTIRAEQADRPQLSIDALDVGLQNWQRDITTVAQQGQFEGESRFIESCVARFHQFHPLDHSLYIRTQSHFARDLGLGSSSATVAATLFALAQLFAPNLSLADIFDMGLDAIRAVQKLGSGADLAAALYGGTLYYINREPRHVYPLEIDELPMVAVYSGQKAGTVSYVQQVRVLRDTYPQVIDPIIQSMLEIVDSGRQAIQGQNWQALGTLMNVQHGLLHALGVDTAALSEVIFLARQAQALGAKLSGAGGGDCAIVLHASGMEKRLRAALHKIGRDILPYGLHADGVRID